MKKYIVSDLTDNLLDRLKHEILAEDIIKKLRPVLEQCESEVKRFIHESMIRGFDRTICKNSIAVFLAEFLSLIARAEKSLDFSSSGKTQILRSDLEALKNSLNVLIRAMEKSLLEKPDIQKQMITSDLRKIT